MTSSSSVELGDPGAAVDPVKRAIVGLTGSNLSSGGEQGRNNRDGR